VPGGPSGREPIGVRHGSGRVPSHHISLWTWLRSTASAVSLGPAVAINERWLDGRLNDWLARRIRRQHDLILAHPVVPTDHDEMYDTPEQAALSTWASTQSADAQVVDVSIDGDNATVVIVTKANSGFNTETSYCTRTDTGKWMEEWSAG
jgi:hypothetical protein